MSQETITINKPKYNTGDWKWYHKDLDSSDAGIFMKIRKRLVPENNCKSNEIRYDLTNTANNWANSVPESHLSDNKYLL